MNRAVTKEQFVGVNWLIPNCKILLSFDEWKPRPKSTKSCTVHGCSYPRKYCAQYVTTYSGSMTATTVSACDEHHADFDLCMEDVAKLVNTTDRATLCMAIRRKGVLLSELRDYVDLPHSHHSVCDICCDDAHIMFGLAWVVCKRCVCDLFDLREEMRLTTARELLAKLHLMCHVAAINVDVLGVIYAYVRAMITNDELASKPELYRDLQTS